MCVRVFWDVQPTSALCVAAASGVCLAMASSSTHSSFFIEWLRKETRYRVTRTRLTDLHNGFVFTWSWKGVVCLTER